MITGLRVRGDAAQVWQHGQQVGNLYRYTLVGVDGAWSASAEKYRLADQYRAGDVELRFFVAVQGQDRIKAELVLHGVGRIGGACVNDGKVRRELVEVDGAKLWIPMGDTQVCGG